MQTTQHLMILPSLACQASCSYCFGPNRGQTMSLQVFTAAMEWMEAVLPPTGSADLTFHGGEPLLAGRAWFGQALPLLRQRFNGALKLGIQSNLWLLDEETCSLFKQYDLSLGTSLDGPEWINDAQRGAGYFSRCMAGIETARRSGIAPGVICTFTPRSARHYHEVFDFFAGLGLSFSVHESVCRLGEGGSAEALGVDEAASLMVKLFDLYLENISRVRIPTFDAMARGISAREGGLCTFGNCLGRYQTVAPDGGIFSCNRFAFHPSWRLGSVFDRPGLETLARSDAWQRLRRREETVQQECGDCTHYAYCKGGCPYNAVSRGTDGRDPNCEVYRRLFDHITDRALEEVFSDENLAAVVAHGTGRDGLMRRGRLIQVMKGRPHPREVARKARETVAAVALGSSSSVEQALDKLELAGVVRQRTSALGSLRSLRQHLDEHPRQGLLNAYLHVTYLCNLSCSHCYANAGPGRSDSMSVEQVERLGREAARAGFSKVVITGGEPLSHPRRDDLLAALADLRHQIQPARLVLRTNLACELTPALIQKLGSAASQIVVSLDGDEALHDGRRGAGSYARTLENLHLLKAAHVDARAEIHLAATLSAAQIAGQQGACVRALAESLGFKLRFKAVLPLGRGASLELTPAYYNSLDDSFDTLVASPGPTATCGLGMNLYIAPDGGCYPCYALLGADHFLGNALTSSLAEILELNDRYRQVGVDCNQKCCACSLRYLCGGFCRAWSSTRDPNSAPRDCSALQERARQLLQGALETLQIEPAYWQAAGLPLSVDEYQQQGE